jgi:hypothetical protein
LHHQRATFFGAALLQLVQKGFDRGNVGKPVPALGVDAQLARRLRAAQHQQAQQHGRLLGHTHAALKIVLPPRGAVAAAFECQAQEFEGVERLLRLGIAELHYRLAAGFLVAAGQQAVERHGVAVGHRAGFLHQRGQHAGLVGREGAGGGAERCGC